MPGVERLHLVRVVDAASAEQVVIVIAEGLQDHRDGRERGPYKDMAEFRAEWRRK